MTDLAVVSFFSSALSALGYLTYLLFRDTMNRVQYYPFKTRLSVYWITRDTGSEKWGRSFMRMTDFPWLTGKGFTAKLGKWSFQLGVARRQEFSNVDEALKHQLGVTDLDMSVEEIRSLKHVNLQKEG